MPSEVARLVLGYLRENGCIRTIRVYLTENSHLKEYVACLQQGHEYPTTIAGKSLIDILQEYCHLKASDKITEKSQCSVEMRQLFTRIEASIAQLKYLVANGHLASGALTTSVVNHTTLQKASTRAMLLAARKEQESLLNLRDDDRDASQTCSAQIVHAQKPQPVSVATETDYTLNDTYEQFTQTSSCTDLAMDSSAEHPDDIHPTTPTAARSTDVTVDGNSVTVSNVSLNSASCSSSTYPTTPINRPLDLYSSPSSIVRSVLLNFGMSEFQTPVKEKYLADDGTWRTPRRKNQLPRKRLTYTPPSSSKKRSLATTPEESELCNSDNVDVNALLDGLLHNTALHERIAANINKVVSNTNQVASSSETMKDSNEIGQDQSQPNICEQQQLDVPVDPLPSQSSAQEEQMPEEVIKSIVDRTESDPMFEAFLSFLFDKQDSNSRDSHVGVSSDDMPSPDTHGTPHATVESATAPSSAACTPNALNQIEPPSLISGLANSKVVVELPDSSVATPKSVSDHCPTPSQRNQLSDKTQVNEESGEKLTKQSALVQYQQCLSNPPVTLSISRSSNTILNQPMASFNSDVPSSMLSSSATPLYYTRTPSVVGSSSNIPVCENVQLLSTIPSSRTTCLLLPSLSSDGSVISPAPVTIATLSGSCLSNTSTTRSDSSSGSLVTHQNATSVSQNLNVFLSQSTAPSKQSGGVISAVMNRTVVETLQPVSTDKDGSRHTVIPQNSQDKDCSQNVEVNLGSISSHVVPQRTAECVSNQRNSSIVYTVVPFQNVPNVQPNRSSEMSELLTDEDVSVCGSNVLQSAENSSLSQQTSTTFSSNQTVHVTITPGKSSGHSQFLTLSPRQLLPLLENHSSVVQPAKKSTKIHVLRSSSHLNNPTFEGAIKTMTNMGNSKKLALRKKSKKLAVGVATDIHVAHDVLLNEQLSDREMNFSNAAVTITNGPRILYATKKLDFAQEKKKAVSILKPKSSRGKVRTVQQTSITQISNTAMNISNNATSPKLRRDGSSELATKQPATGSLQITHSPQLQSLIQSAELLKGVQNTRSHIRALSFTTPKKCQLSDTSDETAQSTLGPSCASRDGSKKAVPMRRAARKVRTSVNKEKQSLSSKSTATERLSTSASTILCLSSSSLDGTGITNFYSKNKTKITHSSAKPTLQKDFHQCEQASDAAKNTNKEASVQPNLQSKNQSQNVEKSPSGEEQTNEDVEPPKKKSRTEGSQNVLSVMDVEKFLSGLQYVE